MARNHPLKLTDIWAIRIRLQMAGRLRDRALFNLAIDSKLRGCDLTCLRVRDVVHGTRIARRAIILQRKTRRPVQFEMTEQTRDALAVWIEQARLSPEQFLFPSRLSGSAHVSIRQYAPLVASWVADIGLDPSSYETHSLRRIKPVLICRRTKNRRGVQILPGHTSLESTVRYLGIEVEDALEMAERADV